MGIYRRTHKKNESEQVSYEFEGHKKTELSSYLFSESVETWILFWVKSIEEE